MHRLRSVLNREVHVYRLTGTDPIVNLAAEDWVFRTVDTSKAAVLLLWRNRPTVVIGRNQNQWTECNMQALADRAIPFVRRYSGGGSVYHDLGNSVFTIISDRASFDRAANAQLVARALKRLEIDATVSPRHDVLVQGHKVSGAAFKLTSKGAYHHATMLISADKTSLRSLLKPASQGLIKSAGVASVPSPTMNLCEIAPHLTHASFCDALADEFIESYSGPIAMNTHMSHASIVNVPHVEKTMEEMDSWEWRFGQTPNFTQDIDGGGLRLQMEVKHGRVIAVHALAGLSSKQSLDLNNVLKGVPFSFNDIAKAIESQEQAATLHQLLRFNIPDSC